MKKEYLLVLLVAGLLAGLLLLSGERKRPIKIIVPFGAGGGSDTAGRMLEKAVAEGRTLENPLVIINVPGGGGTIGSRRAKMARADGHTLLLLHEGIFTARQSGQAPYGAEAFTPIAAFGRTGTFVVVSSKFPHRNLSDLAGYCRANPGKLTFACNLGAPAHFVGMQIQNALDGEFRFVPSGGGSQRVEDLTGGEVQCTIFSSSEFARFGSDEKLHALAYLGPDRHPDFPDIPTAAEQGFPLNAATTQFIWAPKGTPPDVVENLADGFEKALSSPKVIAQFESLAMEPVFFRGEDLLEQIEDREKAIGAITVETPAVFPYFPHIVAGICVLLAALIALTNTPTPNDPVGQRRDSPWLRAMFAGTALAFALALALDVPFILATSLFTFAACCLLTARGKLDAKRIATAAALSIGLASGCFFIFVRVLSIDLP